MFIFFIPTLDTVLRTDITLKFPAWPHEPFFIDIYWQSFQR